MNKQTKQCKTNRDISKQKQWIRTGKNLLSAVTSRGMYLTLKFDLIRFLIVKPFFKRLPKSLLHGKFKVNAWLNKADQEDTVCAPLTVTLEFYIQWLEKGEGIITISGVQTLFLITFTNLFRRSWHATDRLIRNLHNTEYEIVVSRMERYLER